MISDQQKEPEQKQNKSEEEQKEIDIVNVNEDQTPEKSEESIYYIYCTGSICTEPLEKDLPQFAYSAIKSTNPCSYLPNSYQIQQEALTPLYVSCKVWQKIKGIKMKDRFAGNKLSKTNELVCIEKELLTAQKGMFVNVVKKLASSIYQGKGIVGISLPVRIFEPRSFLDRMTDYWSLLPYYLNKACETYDFLERFKLVISGIIGGMHMGISQWKPFNPILGETYQGQFSDGTTIDIEHISHHPPIAAFYIVGKKYKLSGRLHLTAKMQKNSVDVAQEGAITLTFNDGQEIIFYYPYAKLGGVLVGERTNKLQGCLVVYDQEFDKGAGGFFGLGKKRTDILRGEIYTVKDGLPMPRYKNRHEVQKQNIKKKDKFRLVCKIEGSWLSQILIGGQEYWNLKSKEAKPERAIPITNSLPFDWRFREDLIYLKYGDYRKAAIWKHSLEEQQRHERRLRKKYAKENKLVYDK